MAKSLNSAINKAPNQKFEQDFQYLVIEFQDFTLNNI